jgi:hypothetical protein
VGLRIFRKVVRILRVVEEKWREERIEWCV